MPHHDGLPLVFQFPEEDTQPESQEHKALWDELELALREDAAPVPAPVPAPVAPTAPAPIPVALMGWEPHIVAELDATGFHEVPADFHAPVHLPAHAPTHALPRTPMTVQVHLPVHAPARALTCAGTHAPASARVPMPVPVHTNVSAAPLTAHVPARVPVPPSAAWMAAVDRFLAPTPVASSRQLTRSEVQNILAFLEARPTSRSTPTTAQDAAVAVGQWPDDTQSTAEEPLPTARRPRRRRVI